MVVDSCLVPICQVDGSQIRTVEGLSNTETEALSPLQQAFLERGGAQCGICTPGMLMTAQAYLDDGGSAAEDDIREAIAGNLCRCTGYTKIDRRHRSGRRGAQGAGLMVVEPPVVSPATLSEALGLMATGEYRPLAGGTDLMVQLEADVVEPPAAVLDLSRLSELKGISTDGYDVTIGALTTYTELRHSPVLSARLPALVEAAATVGAAQIQNRGTIGGNVCNASPAGDLLPVLLAVDATFDVGSAAGERESSA